MERYDLKDQLRLDSFKGKLFQLIRNGNKDITNTSFLVEFKYGGKDGPVKLTLKVGSGLTKIDLLEGIFQFDPIEFVKLEAGTYYYDIKVSEGNVHTTYQYGYWKIHD